jgi:hypothetical protein
VTGPSHPVIFARRGHHPNSQWRVQLLSTVRTAASPVALPQSFSSQNHAVMTDESVVVPTFYDAGPRSESGTTARDGVKNLTWLYSLFQGPSRNHTALRSSLHEDPTHRFNKLSHSFNSFCKLALSADNPLRQKSPNPKTSTPAG